MCIKHFHRCILKNFNKLCICICIYTYIYFNAKQFFLWKKMKECRNIKKNVKRESRWIKGFKSSTKRPNDSLQRLCHWPQRETYNLPNDQTSQGPLSTLEVLLFLPATSPTIKHTPWFATRSSPSHKKADGGWTGQSSPPDLCVWPPRSQTH